MNEFEFKKRFVVNNKNSLKSYCRQ